MLDQDKLSSIRVFIDIRWRCHGQFSVLQELQSSARCDDVQQAREAEAAEAAATAADDARAEAMAAKATLAVERQLAAALAAHEGLQESGVRQSAQLREVQQLLQTAEGAAREAERALAASEAQNAELQQQEASGAGDLLLQQCKLLPRRPSSHVCMQVPMP